MEENINNERENSVEGNISFPYYRIICVQIITVLILVASIFAIKYFYKGAFNKFRSWYQSTFLVSTSIDEVLGEEGEIDEI